MPSERKGACGEELGPAGRGEAMGVVGAWLQSQKDQTDGEMLLYLASRLPSVDAKKLHGSFTVEFLIARLQQERNRAAMLDIRCHQGPKPQPAGLR